MKPRILNPLTAQIPAAEPSQLKIGAARLSADKIFPIRVSTVAIYGMMNL
jgi:hypothetical protein